MNLKPLAVLGLLAAIGYAVWRRRPGTPLRDQVVVITGGSRGLGLCLARELAAQGAELALVARARAELDRAADELRALGAPVSTWVYDLLEGGGIPGLVSRIAVHHGRIDVLINNAGEIVVGPFEAFSACDFERSLALHLMAPLRLIQAVLPMMKSHGGGRVVNIASIGGRLPVPHLGPYCVGKFALVGLSGTLRAELAKDAIVVTTVCPGLMRAGSHWNAWFKGNRDDEFAWFAHGASLPGVSMGAARAARRIVGALRRGDAELIISAQAQLAVVVRTLAPATVAAIDALVSHLLPDALDHGGRKTKPGWRSRSGWGPSIFTRPGDLTASRNNELRGPRPPA